jgi:hypothetical protein
MMPAFAKASARSLRQHPPIKAREASVSKRKNGLPAEALAKAGRGGPRRAFLNEFGPQQLLWSVFSHSLAFDRDTFLAIGGA